MEDGLSRVSVVYTGGLADDHVLDSREMGTSLLGSAKAYRSVAQTIITGKVPSRKTAPIVVCYTGPQYKGSIGSDIIIGVLQAGVTSGSLALPWSYLQSAYDFLISKLMEATSSLLTGRNQAMEKALEVIAHQATIQSQLAAQNSLQQHELNKLLANGILKSNSDVLTSASDTQKALLSVIEKLADSNRNPIREMVEPVGNSCAKSTHSITNANNLTFSYDVAMAAALRSDKEKIGDMAEYNVNVAAVDIITGNCKFQVDGFSKPIKGNIADPALKIAGNIYTHALDTKSPLTITAKPILTNDDEIKSFVVMNARAR